MFSYGTEGFNLLSETTRNLSTSALSTTEHIWLPTASGPMPIAAVIDGVHYAVHADHLNTPRRLTDASQAVKWQWPYSGFGEIGPQATPAAGQVPLNYGLRYPGQIDDGNGLFYNWHRFYDPRVGRYTSSDPIGFEGGWNRYSYVDGNPLSGIDPKGLNPAALGAGGGASGGPLGGALGGPRGGPTSRPIDPSEPYGPTYTPAPGFKWPSWLSPLFKSPGQRCEKDCEDTYDREIEECRAYSAMTGDKYTFIACKKRAERNLSRCMANCDKDCN